MVYFKIILSSKYGMQNNGPLIMYKSQFLGPGTMLYSKGELKQIGLAGIIQVDPLRTQWLLKMKWAAEEECQ
jgi:hypothetical protein